MNHFGNCPKCRRNDGYLNIGREHWFICKKHKVKWYAGSSIFPGWLKETETVWRQNAILLSSYLEVEPVQELDGCQTAGFTAGHVRQADVITIATKTYRP